MSFLITGGKQNSKAGVRYRRRRNFPFWTLAAHRGGSFRILDADGRIRHYKGRALPFQIIEPNTPYDAVYDTKVIGEIWMLFTPPPEFLPLMRWPEETAGRRMLRVEDRTLWESIYQAMEFVIDAKNSALADKDMLMRNAVERALLLAQSAMKKNTFGTPHDARILKIMDHIHEAPEKNWTLKELGQMAGMSIPNLAHRFSQETGVSPIRYAENQKIEHAKMLLLQGTLSISEISEALGYANPYHFSNRFRVATGKSPRKFRNEPESGYHIYPDAEDQKSPSRLN